MKKKTKKKIITHTFAHIFLIIASLVAIYPILWIFNTSINADNSMFSTDLRIIPKNPTIQNYIQIFKQGDFLIWIKNSTIIALSTTFVSIIIGIISGYAYSRMRFKGRNFGLGMFLLLNAFPSILSIVAIYRLFSFLGLINTSLGLIIIYSSWQMVFSVWNLKGYLDTIPKEIEESALIDGASAFKVFTKIIIPLSKPAIAVTALFAFLASWNEYIVGMVFITDKYKYTLPIGLYNLQSTSSQYATNWTLFAAGSLVIALPIALIFIILQKYLISGLTIGGVKG